MTNPEEVVLCLDNDEAGHKASRRMEEQLNEKYAITIRRVIPTLKDWNDDLCAMREEPVQEIRMGGMGG